MELVEARESLERKDAEIDSLRTSKAEIEDRLFALDHQLQDQKLVAAQPTVVEVIKEVTSFRHSAFYLSRQFSPLHAH